MELSQIIPHIEALIFASDKPLTCPDLVELLNNALGFIEDRTSPEQVETAVEGIREKYSTEFYAFELKQSGGGWQFLTKKEYHKTVAQLNGDKFLKRLSNAALETLAIIAYKQPITKSEIESVRGVNCDYAVQKLLEKDLVIIAGRNEDAVGKPLIYTTSKSFMDYFGINSTEDLPKISEVMMEELVKSTVVNNGLHRKAGLDEPEEPASSLLSVTQNGKIVENNADRSAGEVLPERDIEGKKQTIEGSSEETPGTLDDVMIGNGHKLGKDKQAEIIPPVKEDKKIAGDKKEQGEEEKSES